MKKQDRDPQELADGELEYRSDLAIEDLLEECDMTWEDIQGFWRKW